MMAQQVAVWNGSEVDWYQLQIAVTHHCECKWNQPMCSAHQLLTDQRVLNHLAFARQIRVDVIAKERQLSAT